jgi:hypothetical protein
MWCTGAPERQCTTCTTPRKWVERGMKMRCSRKRRSWDWSTSGIANERAPRLSGAQGTKFEEHTELNTILCIRKSPHLLQVRPLLPLVPAPLKLRLGLVQGRHSIRARHRAGDRHRPEPAQAAGSAAGLIDAADLPLAAVMLSARSLSIPEPRPVGRSLRAISTLWRELRYEFRPNGLHHCPYFLRDGFEDRRFNHVAMDRLQFGRH